VKHFSDAEWADFVRNLTTEGTAVQMKQHTDEGCERCSAALNTWQYVRSMAAAELAFTPPESAGRIARSQFAVMTHVGTAPRLVFDSTMPPLAAGIRGSVAARQFLYETDEYYIDLRVEPQMENDRACVVGQVLKRIGDDRVAQGVPVRIQRGRLPVAHTSTNEFGEFQLEFEAGDSLCVSIANPASEIVLPLYGMQSKSLKTNDLY